METATVTQEKPEVKVMEPYQIKKQKDTGKFKILSEKTGELLEGFEDKEFASPVEASRFMKKFIETAEKSAADMMTHMSKAGKTVEVEENKLAFLKTGGEVDHKVTEFKKEGSQEGFQIPIIEGQSPVIEVIGNTRYFEVVIREHDEPKRTSEPITDGFNTTYLVALGKKVILPEAVINTAKEAVYTIIETHQDDKTLKCTTVPRESPRFSVEITREVMQDEAVKWLREQKKSNINIY